VELAGPARHGKDERRLIVDQPDQQADTQSTEAKGQSSQGSADGEQMAGGSSGSASDEPDRTGDDAQDKPDPLLDQDEQERFRQRWSEIQASFIDQPQRSVEEANTLVADLTDRLVSSFRSEQSELEDHWSRDEEVTTEELRTTLRRYRSFFGRLLEV
jgi:hypothetical protein